MCQHDQSQKKHFIKTGAFGGDQSQLTTLHYSIIDSRFQSQTLLKIEEWHAVMDCPRRFLNTVAAQNYRF